jgi:hypothetical protein
MTKKEAQRKLDKIRKILMFGTYVREDGFEKKVQKLERIAGKKLFFHT